MSTLLDALSPLNKEITNFAIISCLRNAKNTGMLRGFCDFLSDNEVLFYSLCGCKKLCDYVSNLDLSGEIVCRVADLMELFDGNQIASNYSV